LNGKDNIPEQAQRAFTSASAPAELIRDAIAGNRRAQKEIYDRYSPFIYGIIRRYLKDQNAANDVLNDTFFKILTRLKDYSYKGAFEGWMRTIAVNTITDHVRKNLKHEHVVHVETDVPGAGTEQYSTWQPGYKDLLQMVHDLPDTQRLVFNLFVFEDLPHKEIARLLSISENNSRWHLNDARKRLKEKINNHM
jgi:RNA polymerase sigma factor (sigma-70 family)